MSWRLVEAFIAFDEMFYLHLAWAEHCNFPEVIGRREAKRARQTLLVWHADQSLGLGLGLGLGSRSGSGLGLGLGFDL